MKTQPAHKMLPHQQPRVPQSPSDLLCVSPTSKFINGLPGNKRTRSQVLKDLAQINAATNLIDNSTSKRVCGVRRESHTPPLREKKPQSKKPVLTPRSINTHHHHHKKMKKNVVHPSFIPPIVSVPSTSAPKRAPSPPIV
ncbi:hypothetical protein BASA81_006853 [Batrachochytrium salamandrivorans]|nr:hypothetical protein BASA81_006853 [Batrachochytrium salamandrivorans]